MVKSEQKQTIKTSSRLRLVMLAVVLFPLLVVAAGPLLPGVLEQHVLLFAAALAPLAAFFAASVVIAGLTRPMEKAAFSVKKFIAADYRLEAAIPREGWPEAGVLTSSLNRLMLELSAYRAFQLNQVVEERAKAKALVETITDGIMLVDDKGGLIYSNQTALKLMGIPKLSPEINIPGSVQKEVFAAALRGILASEEKYLESELEDIVSNAGCPVHKTFSIISSQFRLATLKRPGRAIAIRDVTGDKEIANAKEAFFHMITHDMRTPLASIQGYAELLGKLITSTPETGKYLQRILDASKRLNGMINDILNTIKLERGDMKLQLGNIDAGELLERVLAAHEPLAARKKIKLSVRPVPEKTVFSGDAGLLERVISNLVGNALKFTPTEGAIALACREEAGQLRFSVEDTGPGIPEGKGKEIFNKYSQLEEHKHMGFGLGLAMCKMSVELHKGYIWVESEKGKGSRFIFNVPKNAVLAR
ncbi:MAG: hypothetical protein A2234_11075 [Elusimicrobia bacterium RIFOXYA2_FULL_58_8]|nr:MAG: hypothetical protein A2285_04475 [Elusimicrobia bacterium RIFOXYA12_FULL_57_11]OGS14423.1 MAG: hypothetical protein A2234_11075 [Elusimicrobia bacterium RIFOXYA2_FULL_58_8]